MTAQLAGPASLIAWVIGALAMLMLAFSVAEASSVLPIVGGIARIPRYTHRDVTAAVIGWTAWVGYCTQVSIAVPLAMRHASQSWPALVIDTTSGDLSAFGHPLAASIGSPNTNGSSVKVATEDSYPGHFEIASALDGRGTRPIAVTFDLRVLIAFVAEPLELRAGVSAERVVRDFHAEVRGNITRMM